MVWYLCKSWKVTIRRSQMLLTPCLEWFYTREHRPRELMLSSIYMERIQVITQRDSKEGLNLEMNLDRFKPTIKCSSGKSFFVAKLTFKTHQHFCFLCFHSRWRFFWFHKDRENTKHLFTLAENNFGERKLWCTRLNFGEILFAATKRAVPGGQYRSILPARVANPDTEFAAYCPLAELAI